jgi:hypothetical protein
MQLTEGHRPMASNDSSNAEFSPQSGKWADAVAALCHLPLLPVDCPACGSESLTAAWHAINVISREAEFDLSCCACHTALTLRMILPMGAPAFFPVTRMATAMKAIESQFPEITQRIQQYSKTMPIAAFAISPLWSKARWKATTYRWHPDSERPPVMGIVFEDAEAGKELFRGLEAAYNHTDRFEEMRISIIEGSPAGQQPGYSVQICPDPDALAMHATGEEIVLDSNLVRFLGKWNRAYPIPGSPPKPLLASFKEEFAKHRQFMLAPVTRRENGQEYFEPKLGIIKHSIEFRRLSDIQDENDPDALALLMPKLIPPRQPSPVSL